MFRNQWSCGSMWPRSPLLAVCAPALILLLAAPSAFALEGAPSWTVTAFSNPTNLAPSAGAQGIYFVRVENTDSALAANGNLCASTLKMPTLFVAQNGAEIHQSTPIAVTGCGKAKTAKTARHSRKKMQKNTPRSGDRRIA
jgi:hypothetical protein